MNHARKTAALNRFGPLKLEGQSPVALKELLEKDDKKYSPVEVDEILEALLTYTGTEQPPAKEEKAETKNVTYQEWTVEPKYTNYPAKRGQAAYRELSGFERIKKVRETAITPDRAKILNDQSEQTLVRLYTAKEIAAEKAAEEKK